MGADAKNDCNIKDLPMTYSRYTDTEEVRQLHPIWLHDKLDRRLSEDWLIVGTSPNFLKTLPTALALKTRVFTGNLGMTVIANPHAHLCTDVRSMVDFADQRKIARENGCEVFTLKDHFFDEHHEKVWHMKGVSRVDYAFENGLKYDRHGATQRDRIAHGRGGGPIITQILIEHGIKRIHYAGHEGYTAGTFSTTREFDQWAKKDYGKDILSFNEAGNTVYKQIIEQHPEVTFTVHTWQGVLGTMFKDIDRPNLEVVNYE